jgi:hypothetical protein
VLASFEALGICWWVGGIGMGLRFQDPGAAFLFYLWSVPVFGFGWVLFGIPVIALGDRILRVPKLLLGAIGAVAGWVVILAPFFVGWALSGPGRQPLRINWKYLSSGPVFGAGIGATALMLYVWLLSRAIQKKSRAIEPPGSEQPIP